MEELFAVGVSLPAHDVEDDGHDDVVGEVLGVLQDGIGDQEDDSDILEAVAGEQEGNTGGFNSISEGGLDLLVDSAGLVDGPGVLDEGEEVGLGLGVLGVLNKSASTALSSSILFSILGLRVSMPWTPQSSVWTTALTCSKGEAARAQATRATRMIALDIQ